MPTARIPTFASWATNHYRRRGPSLVSLTQTRRHPSPRQPVLLDSKEAQRNFVRPRLLNGQWPSRA